MRKKAPETAATGGGELPTAARRKAATDALKEEAERSWAESDRKATTGKRGTPVRAERPGVARDAGRKAQ